MSRFITLWMHSDTAPDQVSATDLEGVERRLETQLPSDYKDAIRQFGLPRPSIDLLDAICDRELDIRDVSDFLGPTEIIEVTEEWRDLGLPATLVAFATDCMGNLFCFPTDPKESREQPVFFWNHESKQIDTVESSFTRWIEDFCRLSPN